tara:strand:+ start:232 stop:924 length:693 start_codon:yes stop_codon:yes gene_type:complete
MYIFGDVHNVIKTLEDDSIDLIYTSPPYGSTKAEWDKPLRWDELFPEMWRVLKPSGVIVLHASMPFTYDLLQHDKPKYHYTWLKNNSTGGLTAKYQPLRRTEEVMVYYNNKPTYNPQMKGDKFFKKRNKKWGTKEDDYCGHFARDANGKKPVTVSKPNEGHIGRYPDTLLEYKIRWKSAISRTDDMMDFFIKTYSNEGDTVLDLTTHNSFLNDRVVALKREFIGIDIVEF